MSSISDSIIPQYLRSIQTTLPGANALPLTESRKFLSDIDHQFNYFFNYLAKVEKCYDATLSIDKREVDVVIKNIMNAFQEHAFTDPLSSKEMTNRICQNFAVGIKAIDTHAPTNKLMLYQKIECIAMESVYSLHASVKVNKLSYFSFSRFDFDKAKTNMMLYYQNQRVMFCYDFAFYHLNEPRAFSDIFNPKIVSDRWPEQFFDKPIEFLAKWGYHPVEKPKSGDLVVYCSTLGEQEAKHWGIYKGEGSVISKWGQLVAFEHQVSDVSISYGNFVYYLRKSPDAVFPSLFSHLRRMKVLKPTPEEGGTLGDITKLIEKRIAVEMEASMPRSLKGPKWIKTVGDEILREIKAVDFGQDCLISVLLDKVQYIVMSAIDNTRCDFSSLVGSPLSLSAEKLEQKVKE